MATTMDALLRIRADVQGENKIVGLSRGLHGVTTAAAGATTAMRGMAGSSALLQSSLGALLPLMSAAGLVGMVTKTIEAGDAMNDLSQRTGVSVEALARFKKAAATSGTDIDSVAKSLNILNKGLYEMATTGKGKAADALAALQISAKGSNGELKTADQVTLEVADKFARMRDGAEKSALAMALFGRSGADMIPMLNNGSDAIEKLSIKMSKAFAEKADAYSDKLAVLSGKVGSLGADLTIALLPVLDALTDALIAGVTAFNAMPDSMKTLTVGAAGLAVAWGPLTSALKEGSKLAKTAANGFEILRYQTTLAGGVMPLLAGGLDSVKVAMLAIPGWGWAALGVTALAGISVALYNTNDNFKDFVDNVGDIVKSDFKNAMETMGSIADETSKFIAGKWTWLVNEAEWASGEIVKAFAGKFGFIAEVAQTIFSQVGDQITALINRIPAPIRNALGYSAGVTGGIVQRTAPAQLIGTLGPVGAYLTSLFGRASAAGPRQRQGTEYLGPGGGPNGQNGETPRLPAFDLGGSGATGAGGGAAGARGGGAVARPRTVQELFGLSDAEMAAAVTTALGEYGGRDPRGRTDVFANILARREAGNWGKNLLNIVTAPGQYAPNTGRTIAQLADPAFGKRLYGTAAFNAALAELQNPQLVGQSIRDIDSRLYFKGISEYRNMVPGADFLRAPGQNFFHDEGARDPGRAARTQALLARLAGAGAAADELRQAGEEQERLRKEREQQLAAAKDLVAAREAELRIALATTPIERLQLEYARDKTEKAQEYAGKLADAKSEDEKTLLLNAQAVDLQILELQHKEKLADATKEQLRLEKERLAVMRELTTRSDVGAGVMKGLQDYSTSLGYLRDSVADFTNNSLQGLEGALTDLATKGSADFRQFAVSMLNDLTKLIIRQLIFKTILDSIGGMGGGASITAATGSFGNYSGAFLPGAMADIPFTFAKGGIVNNPTLFKFARGGAMQDGLMGEAGPEAIMPLRRDSSGRLGVAAAGGAPVTVNVSVDATGSKVQGDSGRGEQLGRLISQAVQGELIRQKRPGGLLAT